MFSDCGRVSNSSFLAVEFNFVILPITEIQAAKQGQRARRGDRSQQAPAHRSHQATRTDARRLRDGERHSEIVTKT